MKNYTLKKILKGCLLGISILFGTQITAQTASEFSINASGIFGQLDYELPNGTVDPEKGYSFGLGYSFYLNTQWAITLEGNYQGYETEAWLKNLNSTAPAVDIEGEEFQFRYRAENFREKQTLDVIHIPLALQFQTDGETKWYVRAGGQVGILLSSEYKSSIEGLTTSGYYSQYDVELFDPQFMGFGSYAEIQQKPVDLDWNTSFSAIFETGIKAEAGDNGHLYIGFFMNYGLTSLNDEKEPTSAIEYQKESPETAKINSLFDSGLAKDAKLTSFGIKLRYGIGGF